MQLFTFFSKVLKQQKKFSPEKILGKILGEKKKILNLFFSFLWTKEPSFKMQKIDQMWSFFHYFFIWACCIFHELSNGTFFKNIWPLFQKTKFFEIFLLPFWVPHFFVWRNTICLIRTIPCSVLETYWLVTQSNIDLCNSQFKTTHGFR